MPVLEDVAERLGAELGVVEMKKERCRALARLAVAHQDVVDGSGVARQRGPKAEPLEEPARSEGQGRDPAIEPRIRRRAGIERVDHGDRQPALREREAQALPHHAAARDHDVEFHAGSPLRISR